MKVEYRSGSPERRILTGMIVSQQVIARISSKWIKGGLFRSQWANLVGEWCVDYFAKYNKAPGKDIVALFEAWSKGQDDNDDVSTVDKFLSSLSDQYAKLGKEINAELVIDQAGDHFNRVMLEKFKDAIEGHLERDELDKALQLKDKLDRIQMGPGEWTDVLRDPQSLEHAFNAKNDVLISLPGDLGTFFDQALERDAFVSLMAPEKRGKSWVLQELCWQAMTQGRRVAMFQVGDLSKNQIMRRLAVRAARHPLRPCEVRIPISMKRSQEDETHIDVEYKTKVFESGLHWKQAELAYQKVITKVKTHDSLFRLSVHPNSTISMKGINEYLTRWEREGWSADVVCIDYADILAPIDGKQESREQVNASWKYMRRISQERHCLVLTATQTDAQSYDADLIRRRNFSEDKRKFAHVTAMFAINQTDQEKQRGIVRLNWSVLREGEFIESDVVHVAGALGIANPFMKSCY